MDLNLDGITPESLVVDIVAKDHRAADIFRKYNISYCCGGKISLQQACELNKIDFATIQKELSNAFRVIKVSNSIDFNNWSIDFLIDYIVNIHHAYLVVNMPEIADTMDRFVKSHQAKYPYLANLMDSFMHLSRELFPHLEQEEKIIFPYIKQVAHAYDSREPYAGLLVRTLRKSIETMMVHEQEHIESYLFEFRKTTNNYVPPPGACITHKVALSKLKELDADLVQHIYLENEILFPKTIQIEKELRTINK